jgi:PAS domain S-box-containing protein
MQSKNYIQHISAHLDASKIGILVESQDRTVIYTNAPFYKMFGMPEGSNLIGENCEELLKNAVNFFSSPEIATEFINKALESKKESNYYPLFSSNKNVFKLTYLPVWENSEYIGHIWEYENLTDEFQRNQELSFRQKMFDQLFQLKLDNSIESLNEAKNAYSAQFKDIIHDTETDKYFLKLPDLESLSENGKYIDVSSLLEFVSSRDTIHQNQHLALSEFPISIFYLDIKKGITDHQSLKFVGGNIKLVTGYDESEFKIKKASLARNNVHPAYIDNLNKAYKKFLRSKNPTQVEFKWKDSSGEFKWLRMQTLFFSLEGLNGYMISILQNINDFKAAQDKIAQQDLALSSLLDNLNDAVIQVDTNLNITYSNKSSELISGWNPYELINQHISKLSHKISDILQSEILSFLPEIRNLQAYEFPLISKNESYKWVKLNARPLLNLNNDIIGITCSISSIHEVKEYQNQLNRTTQQLNGFAKNSFEGNLQINLVQEKIEYISSNFKTITGYEIDDLNYKSYTKYIHPDDINWYVNKLKSDIHDKVVSRILKFRFIQKTGKMIWVRESAKINYNESGIPIEYISTITDVTSLIEAERRASENFEKFRIIAENSKDMVSLIDSSGICEFVSGAIHNFGYEHGNLNGNQFLDYIYPEDKHLIEPILNGLEVNKFNEVIEFRILKKDQTPVWVEANLSVFGDVEFHPIGIVLNIRDISERMKRMEEVQFKNNLVQAISEAQLSFINSSDPKQALGIIMQRLIELTQSDFGFIGEIQTNKEGIPSLLSHYLTDISWDENTRKMYQESHRDGIRFSNLNSLFGYTIRTGELVLTNDPKNDPRSGGLPLGHPALNSYLGLPLWSGDKLIGMIGLGNRLQGYDLTLIEMFKPIWTVSSAIIQSYLDQKNLRDTKRELESSESQIKAILTSMEDLVFELNIDLDILHFWNNNNKNSHVKINPANNYNLKDLPEPFGTGTLDVLIKKVFEDGQTRSVELPYFGSSKDIWYQIKISRIDDANAYKVSMLVQDISVRKSVEKEVERLKDFYELLLNNLPIDVVVFSKEQKYLYINHKAVSDKSRRDWLIGKNDFEYAQKYGLSDIYVLGRKAMFNKVLETKQILEFEEEYPNKLEDGSSKWVLRFFTPILNSENEIDHILGFGLEISERKKAELDTLTNLDRQKELNELKNKFVSTISHEFRTPLATIRSSMDLMDIFTDKKEIQIPKIKEFIGVVNNEIQILTSLLNDVLLMGRHEARQTPFHPKLNQVDLVIQNVISQNFRFIQNREIKVDCAIKLKNIEFDEKLISHVFSNVISNAIKYSEQDVFITITQDSNETIVSIKDSGIGIPEEDLNRLFNSFFRASNSKDFQGTGLGLVIVKNFVEMHGGSSYIKSKVDVGTEFIIKLPNKIKEF